MAKLFSKDCILQTAQDYVDFADSMECSTAILEKLKHITAQLHFHKIIADINSFKGNFTGRYCGQSFNDKTVWIGLYFNNIGFSPEYKLVLAIWEGDDKENIKQKLSNALLNYKSQYFKPVEERWLFIYLDKYLLVCDDQTVEKEINRIIDRII
ncbi:MAG: hypothetical protein K5681_09775 [Treponema sp.]|nr:hypothetical protein [Treponema sp.]